MRPPENAQVYVYWNSLNQSSKTFQGTRIRRTLPWGVKRRTSSKEHNSPLFFSRLTSEAALARVLAQHFFIGNVRRRKDNADRRGRENSYRHFC